MAADEEFRKVAEDMRELMRSLRSELRTARWDARTAAHEARRDWREYRRTGVWPLQHQDWSQRWGPGVWTPPMGPWGAPPPQQPQPPAGAAPPGAPAGTAPGAPAGTAPGPAADAAPPGAPTATAPEADTTAAPGAASQPPPGPYPGTPGAPGPGGAPPPHYGPHPWGGPPRWPWGPFNGPPPGSRAATATMPVRPVKPERPAAPPVRHKRDGSTLLSLLLVLVGLAWLGSAAGIVSLSLETVLATVLVVLGAGMVVTARTDWSLSRRHWPVWLGLVVLVLVIASANSGGLANGVSNLHFGPTNATPTSWTDMATPITNFAGPITIDLSTVTPPINGANETLRVHDVFGPIAVTLPSAPSFRVLIRAHTSFGPVSLLGADRRGGGVFTTKTAEVNSTGRPTLNLDITDAFGPITVSQPGSSSGSQSVSPKPIAPSQPKLPPSP
jgi:hypothetical protein